jgi:hypothetical protein
MAAQKQGDQKSKEEMAKGMSEAGKDEMGKVSGKASKGSRRGHGADPGKISEGMSEAGSPGTGSSGGAKGRSR